MSNFIVAADSGCDLSIEFCQNRKIFPLFMNYENGGTSYPDTMRHSDLKIFYNGMVSGDVIRTCAVNIHDYLTFWESLLVYELPIVHITLGSAISATYQNALLAKEEFCASHPDAKIFVVDSTVASAGFGLLACEAADMRDKGASAEECAEYLESIRHSVSAIFTTADLTYLYRGGRVKKTSMVIAHALGILPILNLNDIGELKIYEKCRGRRAAYKRIVEMSKSLVHNPENQTLYVAHSDFADEAEVLGTMLKETCGFKDVFYTYIGSTIGAHTGPGLIAVFFKGEERKPSK